MIECRGVSFSYDGAVPALDGVDLNIEDGEFFCILGGNGSGKSTFAKHLNALLQPDAGTVRINGMDASDPRAGLRHSFDRGHGIPESRRPAGGNACRR